MKRGDKISTIKACTRCGLLRQTNHRRADLCRDCFSTLTPYERMKRATLNQLRAYVFKDEPTGVWIVRVDHPNGKTAVTNYRHSWPEAMQWAYKLLKDLDKALMDEVHASRASRRKATA